MRNSYYKRLSITSAAAQRFETTPTVLQGIIKFESGTSAGLVSINSGTPVALPGDGTEWIVMDEDVSLLSFSVTSGTLIVSFKGYSPD